MEPGNTPEGQFQHVKATILHEMRRAISASVALPESIGKYSSPTLGAAREGHVLAWPLWQLDIRSQQSGS
jgi:hypothetical protein